MSNTKHTPEPWVYDAQGHQGIITDTEGFTIVRVECVQQPGPGGLVGPQVARIVSCVNALAGIDNPALAIKAAREALDSLSGILIPASPDGQAMVRTVARRALALLGGIK